MHMKGTVSMKLEDVLWSSDLISMLPGSVRLRMCKDWNNILQHSGKKSREQHEIERR